MVPLTNVDVQVSYNKCTYFTKNENSFIKGNDDWFITLKGYKDGNQFDFTEIIKVGIKYPGDMTLYELTEDMYTLVDGSITINGNVQMVSEAGRCAIIVMDDNDVSYPAYYDVFDSVWVGDFEPLPPITAEYIQRIEREDGDTGYILAYNQVGVQVARWLDGEFAGVNPGDLDTINERLDDIEDVNSNQDNSINNINGAITGINLTNVMQDNDINELKSKNYYTGFVTTDTIEVLQQDSKTDEELAVLLGLNSGVDYTINQIDVVYTDVGTYPVVITFTYGYSITVYVDVVMEYTYTRSVLREYTQDLPNPANFGTLYDLTLDFSNGVNIIAPAGLEPTVNGNTYEWINKDPSNIRDIDIVFTNVAPLSGGRTLDVLVNFKPLEIHSKISTYQRFGFTIDDDGRFIPLQNGFTLLGCKMSFFYNTADIFYGNIAMRFDDVNYARHVGARVGESEFFVDPLTKLLGSQFEYNDSGLGYFIASKYTGDEDTPGADNVALGIVKQDISTLQFVIGKEYTGTRVFDYGAQVPLSYPLTTRIKELVETSTTDLEQRVSVLESSITGLTNDVSDLQAVDVDLQSQITDLDNRLTLIESVSREPQRVLENSVQLGISVPSNTWVTLLEEPASTFTVNKSYNMDSEVRGSISTQGTYLFRLISERPDPNNVGGVLETIIIGEQSKNFANISDVFLSPPRIIKPYILNDGLGVTLKFQMRKNTSSGTGATVYSTLVNVHNK